MHVISVCILVTDRNMQTPKSAVTCWTTRHNTPRNVERFFARIQAVILRWQRSANLQNICSRTNLSARRVRIQTSKRTVRTRDITVCLKLLYRLNANADCDKLVAMHACCFTSFYCADDDAGNAVVAELNTAAKYAGSQLQKRVKTQDRPLDAQVVMHLDSVEVSEIPTEFDMLESCPLLSVPMRPNMKRAYQGTLKPTTL